MKTAVIIPGLGDHVGYIRRATSDWSEKYEIEPHIFSFGWGEPVEQYNEKYQKFLGLINELSETSKVAIIGISAGAGLALNASADLPDRVSSVVNICGRVKNEKRGMWSFKGFPLHWKCIEELQKKNIDSRKVLTFRPLFDETVPVSDVLLEGADNKRVFVGFHIASIFWVLFTKGKTISNFINSS